MAHDKNKFDYSAMARHLNFDKQAALYIVADFANLAQEMEHRTLTEHALRQTFSKLGPAVFGKGSSKVLPFDYLTAIPAELRATCRNQHLANGNGSRWLIRTDGDRVRAILDGNYPGGANERGDFENTQYLKIVQSFIDEQPEAYTDLKLVRPYVSADEMGIKISWRDVSPFRDENGGSYAIGTYIGNSEIGTGKLKISPFVQRHQCENSIIYDRDNALEFVHRGSFAAMRTQFNGFGAERTEIVEDEPMATLYGGGKIARPNVVTL